MAGQRGTDRTRDSSPVGTIITMARSPSTPRTRSQRGPSSTPRNTNSRTINNTDQSTNTASTNTSNNNTRVRATTTNSIPTNSTSTNSTITGDARQESTRVSGLIESLRERDLELERYRRREEELLRQQREFAMQRRRMKVRIFGSNIHSHSDEGKLRRSKAKNNKKNKKIKDGLKLLKRIKSGEVAICEM